MAYTFKDIIAWQKAYDFTLLVYQTTRSFPDVEKYGLSSQFQRAAVSIAANIAEGYKRLGKHDKLHFMNFAQGSLEECRCYTMLSKDLGYITEDVYNALTYSIEGASYYLNAYCKAIKEDQGIKD